MFTNILLMCVLAVGLANAWLLISLRWPNGIRKSGRAKKFKRLMGDISKVDYDPEIPTQFLHELMGVVNDPYAAQRLQKPT